MARARRSGSSLLKIPEPTNTASAPSCIARAASAGVAIPPAQNRNGRRPVSEVLARAEWRLKLLRPIEELGRVSPTNTTNIPKIERRWRTASTIFPVPALPFDGSWPPSEMRRTLHQGLLLTYERDIKFVLINVVGFIGGSEHFRLVDEVNTEALDDLRFNKVANSCLSHHRDRDLLPDTSIMSGSLIRAIPPSRRISAGTRSSAITAHAPASSAIFACSG